MEDLQILVPDLETRVVFSYGVIYAPYSCLEVFLKLLVAHVNEGFDRELQQMNSALQGFLGGYSLQGRYFDSELDRVEPREQFPDHPLHPRLPKRRLVAHDQVQLVSHQNHNHFRLCVLNQLHKTF